MSFSPEQIRWIIQALLILLAAIAIHEFGHAFVADKLGDRLPRRQGRVTLNPVRHADPIGTLLFPIMGLIVSKGTSIGFGWGKPVQVQPVNFTRRFAMRTGHMFVALAGPMMNVFLGTLIAFVHLALHKAGVVGAAEYKSFIPVNAAASLQYAVVLNYVLFFFNLVPTYPLDGGAVVAGLLPRKLLATYEKYSIYAPFVLLALIMTPAAKVFVVPAYWCRDNLYSLLGVPL